MVLILSSTIASGEDLKMYTVLSGQEAKNIVNQCSRTSPQDITDFWIPDEKVIASIESNLEIIEQLDPELCCFSNVRISNVQNYFRQYVGILYEGHRLIYINAFLGPHSPKNWQTEAVIACDGGTSFWGVIFDPETGQFSQLAINGVA